ncbi:sugar ABC transporter substrate-binding protein, partial [Rhizobium ruizarguesonis]
MIKRLLAATSIATLCLVSAASAAENVEMWVRSGIGDAFKKVV